MLPTFASMLLAALLSLAALAQGSEAGTSHPLNGQRLSTESRDDIVQPQGFPELGRWMIDRDGMPAHWLGEIYRGKKLREPINVIVVDAASSSPEGARKRLIEASSEAGYPVRMGHSTGYQGYIGGELYPQLPQGWDDAFSNGPFELSNNHGRIFGPRREGDAYVFIGAFSREEVDLFRWPEHQFASFNRARDDFSQKLAQRPGFELVGFVDMKNAMVNDPSFTTGDHDGMAVVLRSTK